MTGCDDPEAQESSESPGAPEAPGVPFLIGSTASGKSALALRLCEVFEAELLSLDSMQVYRGMDIGTAKPTLEEQARLRHHLIDLVEPHERYDVQRFVRDFRAARDDCRGRGVRAIAVGGTGLYLQALLRGMFDGPPPDMALRDALKARVRDEGLATLVDELARVDPESAARIHPNDEKRVLRALEVHHQTGRAMSDWQREWKAVPRPQAKVVGLSRPVPELDRRIRARTEEMLDAGWVEEARAVRDGAGFGPTAVQALGYREVLALADGELARPAASEAIALATRQFARRQRTWFRRFEAFWVRLEEASATSQSDCDPLELGGMSHEKWAAQLGWNDPCS